MTLNEIFNPEYLFNPTPPQETKLYLPLLIVFGACILFAVASKFAKPRVKKYINRFFYTLLICGISGLIYLFSRYEGLPWLGSRLFLILIMAVLAIWLSIDMITLIISMPKHLSAEHSQDRYNRYLPKPKKASKKMSK